MPYAAKNAEQSLRAEVRGAEEGHLARLNDDGSIAVKSHSTPGVTYTVQFWGLGAGDQILFQCSCPAGRHAKWCKHATRAARRLEREGIAQWAGGHWYVTPKAEGLMAEMRAKHLAPEVQKNVDRLMAQPDTDSDEFWSV